MQSNLLSWVSIAGASFCHVAWTYSLKFIQLPTHKTVSGPDKWLFIGPWLGYFAFGALDSVLLSTAMRTIPTPTVIAVWVSMALLFLKLIDTFWFHANSSFAELFFLGLIIVGIVGLKLSTQAT